MENKTTDFGKLCRSYRARLGLFMADISDKTGVPQSTITKIEQGSQKPSFDYLWKSMDAYGITGTKERLEFFLSCLNSSDSIEIPLAGFGPKRKEWLAALCIFGEVAMQDPNGWKELISWVNKLSRDIKKLAPRFTTFTDKINPL